IRSLRRSISQLRALTSSDSGWLYSGFWSSPCSSSRASSRSGSSTSGPTCRGALLRRAEQGYVLALAPDPLVEVEQRSHARGERRGERPDEARAQVVHHHLCRELELAVAGDDPEDPAGHAAQQPADQRREQAGEDRRQDADA